MFLHPKSLAVLSNFPKFARIINIPYITTIFVIKILSMHSNPLFSKVIMYFEKFTYISNFQLKMESFNYQPATSSGFSNIPSGQITQDGENTFYNLTPSRSVNTSGSNTSHPNSNPNNSEMDCLIYIKIAVLRVPLNFKLVRQTVFKLLQLEVG